MLMSKRNTNIRWNASLNDENVQAFTRLDKVLRENEIRSRIMSKKYLED